MGWSQVFKPTHGVNAGRGLLLAWSLAAAACQTGGRKETSGSGGTGGSGGGGGSKESGDGGGPSASSRRVTFTNSMSNNPLTSETVNRNKVEAEAERFKSAASKDERALESYIAAARLAGKPAPDLLGGARRLAEMLQEKGGAAKSVPDEVRLEVALAAVQTRNFALAEYLLQDLTEAKNGKVKAGAFNAMGAIALRDDRVPEAVLYFKEALKAQGGYKPALLNLGLAALKGGDLQSTKSALGSMQNDWFVQYAMITVARLGGEDSRAAELCERVLKKDPQHIAALFNCGLFEYQNRHNVGKAKELLAKAQTAKGGESGWGEKAARAIAQIDQDEAVIKQNEARKKAEAAQAAQVQKAQKAQKAAPKPQKPDGDGKTAPATEAAPPSPPAAKSTGE